MPVLVGDGQVDGVALGVAWLARQKLARGAVHVDRAWRASAGLRDQFAEWRLVASAGSAKIDGAIFKGELLGLDHDSAEVG